MKIHKLILVLAFISISFAGIAQAFPEINGTTLLPLNPKRRIILSIKNTTRLI